MKYRILYIILFFILSLFSYFIISLYNSNYELESSLDKKNLTIQSQEKFLKIDSILFSGNLNYAKEILDKLKDEELKVEEEIKLRKKFIERRINKNEVKTELFDSLKLKLIYNSKKITDLEDTNAILDKIAFNYQVQMNNLNKDLEKLNFENKEISSEVINLKKQIKKIRTEKLNLEFEYENGIKIFYLGNVEEGKANGFGYGIFLKKGLYIGDWKDNLRHGQGKYSWDNGDIYEGDFKNGKIEGVGTYYFKSGEKYEGSWKNNVRNGKGTFFDKNGKVILDGFWENDEFINSTQ